jgi:hypothetical protein
LTLRSSIAVKWTQFSTKEMFNMLLATSHCARIIGIFIFSAAIAHSANAKSSDDACSLLTSAQVGAVLGVSMGAGTYVTPTFKKTCTWNATENGGGTVTLNLQDPTLYESGKKLASNGKSVSASSIGGIGDDAYYFGSDKLVSLIVRKGSVAFKVAVYGRIPIEKQQAAEKSLALQVVSQL